MCAFFSSAAFMAGAGRRKRERIFQFPNSFSNRFLRDTGCFFSKGSTATSDFVGFGRGPKASRTFVEERLERRIVILEPFRNSGQLF